jgi:hypothetical protein
MDESVVLESIEALRTRATSRRIGAARLGRR